jgi:superfamily I DNA/RNA helicase
MMYRREVEDLLAYLEVAAGAGDGGMTARRSCIHFPGIGRATVRHVEEYAMRHGIGFIDALRRADDNDALTNSARTSIKAYLDFVDLLRDRASEGPSSVLDEVLAADHWQRSEERSGSLNAKRDVRDFFEAVRRWDETRPPRTASSGPEGIRKMIGYFRHHHYKSFPSRPRVSRRLATGHVLLVLALIVGFVSTALGVDIENSSARIVSQTKSEGSREVTVEFEHEGQVHRAVGIGDFEAAKGESVEVWFPTDDPEAIEFDRWKHFIGPTIIGGLLLAWLIFAVGLRFSLDPWR